MSAPARSSERSIPRFPCAFSGFFLLFLLAGSPLPSTKPSAHARTAATLHTQLFALAITSYQFEPQGSLPTYRSSISFRIAGRSNGRHSATFASTSSEAPFKNQQPCSSAFLTSEAAQCASITRAAGSFFAVIS